MRQVIAPLVVAGSVVSALAAQGTGSAAGASSARIPACPLLTKELITQVSPYDKQVLDLVLKVPPTEDELGASGSACSYGGVTLQVDPFTAQALDQQRTSSWVAVPDVGDAAFFVGNRGKYAELYTRAGARVLTVQMDVPTGRTTESVKPNVIALAKEVLPKLK